MVRLVLVPGRHLLARWRRADQTSTFSSSNCPWMDLQLPHSGVLSTHLLQMSDPDFIFSSEILKGGVKITHNPLLCHTETIQWWDILDNSSSPSMLFKMDNLTHTCMYEATARAGGGRRH